MAPEDVTIVTEDQGRVVGYLMPKPESLRPVLNADEQEVMDHLLAAMHGIHAWKPWTNTAELAQAVHVIQGFIVQHMLVRLAPEAWGNWYGDLEPGADDA